jgi:urocanate hydratase
MDTILPVEPARLTSIWANGKYLGSTHPSGGVLTEPMGTRVVGTPRDVRPATGTTLRCRGWRQEGLLRLLENTIANGERPRDLVIYGGSAQAVRNWDCFEVVVESLLDLGDEETLVMQSGKPVARFRTREDGPRVLTSTSQLVPRWATWEVFHRLRAQGLMMYGQYTAGAWQYIGRQGILQSTYETLAECARQNFDGTLAGRVVLSAGLGAMGSAQPVAIAFLGGVAVVVEVDDAKIGRGLAEGFLDVLARDEAEAMRVAREAAADRRPLSIGILGNAAEVLPALLEAGFAPDVVTDQTSAHDAREGYIPAGCSMEEAAALRRSDPDRYEEEALRSIRRHCEAMLGFQDRGSVVFEYGNAIREQAVRAGLDRAFDLQGFVRLYIRPNFCVGRGPCRWIALSGDPADIEAIDRAILTEFVDDPSITSWIEIAMKHVPHQGLPARTSWFAYAQRLRFATMVNRMVADGSLSAPVALSRDHLDAGSVAQPTRETEGMQDGSDPVADWPVLNALLNTAAGADLVALHQGGGSGMGGSISAGVTVVIDGTEATQARLERVLRTDPGLGVIRHADAGYEASLQALEESDLVAPMIARGRTGRRNGEGA